jgi:hypothetical protein
MLIQTKNYYDLLKDYSMTNKEKNDFIHIIARIMESFVDRAFGIDSVQLIPTCDTRTISQESRENARLNNPSFTNNFNAIAAY